MYSSEPPSQMPSYPAGQILRYPIPAPVKAAVWLICALAALQLAVQIILDLAINASVLSSLIFPALWVWLAARIWRGRNFGRIGATALCGLYTFVLVLTLVSNGPPADILVTILFFWLLTLTIVTLLWLSSSTEHFRPGSTGER
jgi:hypothetical protein